MAACLFCPTIECGHKRRERFSNRRLFLGREGFVMYLECIFGYNTNAGFFSKQMHQMYPPCICDMDERNWQMQDGSLNCSGFVDKCISNFTKRSIEYRIFTTSGGGLLDIPNVRQTYNGVVSKCHISDLEAGDIIWTYIDNPSTYQHVMFYMGNEKVAGLNHPGKLKKNGIYDITEFYQKRIERDYDLLIPHVDTRRSYYIDKLSFDLI